MLAERGITVSKEIVVVNIKLVDSFSEFILVKVDVQACFGFVKLFVAKGV